MENNIIYTFSENGPTFQEIMEEILLEKLEFSNRDWLILNQSYIII